MNQGITLSNVTTFIQYYPSKALDPFVSRVTEMRIAAEKNNQPTKGASAKIFGNSGYGKFSLQILKIFINPEDSFYICS